MKLTKSKNIFFKEFIEIHEGNQHIFELMIPIWNFQIVRTLELELKLPFT